MRMAMMIIAVGVIFAWMLSSASATDGLTGKIDITATIVSTRVEAFPNLQGTHRSTHLRLWNRSITNKPIGHSFLTCAFVGKGGILGKGVWNCAGVYRLPLGLITSAGLAHSNYRYTSAITGGTGEYLGQNGVIFTRRIGPNTLRIIMRLP